MRSNKRGNEKLALRKRKLEKAFLKVLMKKGLSPETPYDGVARCFVKDGLKVLGHSSLGQT